MMKPSIKRTIAVALAVILMVSLPGGRACAMQYTGTNSYMSGKYYQKLRGVKLTGNPRTDIVAVAKSQVGYQEGGSVNQLSGEVYGGVNFTECGAWYGLQDMWCAMFVSWCANLAGVSVDTIPSHSYTPDGLSWFAERGLAYSRAEVQSRKYTPKPGDLIYFKSSRNAKLTNHVGIVTAYSDGRIYTVEGNVGAVGITTNGGMVAEFSYPISNNYIVFICTPNYENGSTSVPSDRGELKEALRLESLREALFAVETGEEFDYDAVKTHRMGGVSVGCGQWYGAKARSLLSQIHQADPEAYLAIDPEQMLLEGNLTCLSSEGVQTLQKVLSSDAGVQVQNDWMDQSLKTWTDRATTLGVTDPDALLLCAALFHLRGDAAAERIIAEAGTAPTRETLLNVIRGQMPELYRTCCLLVA